MEGRVMTRLGERVPVEGGAQAHIARTGQEVSFDMRER